MAKINSLLNSIFEVSDLMKIQNVGLQLNTPTNVEESRITECLAEILQEEVGYRVRNKVVPQFWSHYQIERQNLKSFSSDKFFTSLHNERELQQWFQQFAKSINELHPFCDEILKLLQKHGTAHLTNEEQFKRVLGKSLLSQIPECFKYVVHAFYYISLRVYNSLNHNKIKSADSQSTSNAVCNGCSYENDCQCQQLNNLIREINKKLVQLDLLDRIGGQAVTVLVQQIIRDHIKETCYGIFDKSHFNDLELWLDKIVISWLRQIFSCSEEQHEQRKAAVQEIIECFKVKLNYFLLETYSESIIEQFFGIIIDFPDSKPAVDDLKMCMSRIDIRKNFIKTLKNMFEQKILHPGVNTIDILTGYVAAIKTIRYLDESGVILEIVSEPIKDYLRNRSDTVRTVVTGLTEEGPTELSEELLRTEKIKDPNRTFNSDEQKYWEEWTPEPFGFDDVNRIQLANKNRSADVIAMVIDIYGSNDLFMNEYRSLMADRIISQLDLNPVKEIRNLELLKVRFGESLLHNCEVMLKDVTDSKRINAHIQSDTAYINEKQFDISSLIISAEFWPSFNKESLALPEEYENEFKKYTKSYEAYKGNRTLNWRSVIGKVNLELEVGSRTLEFTCSPTQAVLIYHFQNRNTWNLEDLSTLIKVPQTTLRRRINFWQTHGILTEISPNVFQLIENEEETACYSKANVSQSIFDDEMESMMASASDQREEELQVFWSYIVGMLTNLDSLPLERIHQMLKLFASNGTGMDFSQQELKDFLQRKVREQKLLFSGGVYQLSK